MSIPTFMTPVLTGLGGAGLMPLGVRAEATGTAVELSAASA